MMIYSQIKISMIMKAIRKIYQRKENALAVSFFWSLFHCTQTEYTLYVFRNWFTHGNTQRRI